MRALAHLQQLLMNSKEQPRGVAQSERTGVNPLLLALCQEKKNEDTQQTCTQDSIDEKSSK